MKLLTQLNECRCHGMIETHILSIEPCCPISGNPQKGSFIKIMYEPKKYLLEVQSLRSYIDGYRGGKDDIRSMESMIQNITQDCANLLLVNVKTEADLIIKPDQKMILNCFAEPV